MAPIARRRSAKSGSARRLARPDPALTDESRRACRVKFRPSCDERQVAAVGVDVLSEQGDFGGSSFGEGAHLADELRERPALLFATHRRHDAERARVVAADLDRYPGGIGKFGADRLRGGKRLGVVRRRVEDLHRRRAGPSSLVQQVGEATDVVGPEDRVDVRRTLEDLRTGSLSHAAGDRDLHPRFAVGE